MFLTLATESKKGKKVIWWTWSGVLLKNKPERIGCVDDVGIKIDWTPAWKVEADRFWGQLGQSLIIWPSFLQ
jgi:hypothetical protein